jgi:hypothetical protein
MGVRRGVIFILMLFTTASIAQRGDIDYAPDDEYYGPQDPAKWWIMAALNCALLAILNWHFEHNKKNKAKTKWDTAYEKLRALLSFLGLFFVTKWVINLFF